MLRGSEPIATIGFRADNASPPSLASTLFVVAAASGPHEQRHVLASWRASVRPGAGVEHIAGRTSTSSAFAGLIRTLRSNPSLPSRPFGHGRQHPVRLLVRRPAERRRHDAAIVASSIVRLSSSSSSTGTAAQALSPRRARSARLVEADPSELASGRLREHQVPPLDCGLEDPAWMPLRCHGRPVGPDGQVSLTKAPARADTGTALPMPLLDSTDAVALL